MRHIVKAALAIPEMQFAFECICADDSRTQGKEVSPEDYCDEVIVSEAEYRLSTYFEDGHINDDMRLGEEGAEGKKIAQKDVRMLKAFIKKYKTMDSMWSKYTNHLIK